MVTDRDKEKANPVTDPDRLDRLSGGTKAVGGRSLEPVKLAVVLDQFIANPPIEKIKTPTIWRIGETFEDSTAFPLIFVAVLTTEWFLRKKWQLVEVGSIVDRTHNKYQGNRVADAI